MEIAKEDKCAAKLMEEITWEEKPALYQYVMY